MRRATWHAKSSTHNGWIGGNPEVYLLSLLGGERRVKEGERSFQKPSKITHNEGTRKSQTGSFLPLLSPFFHPILVKEVFRFYSGKT